MQAKPFVMGVINQAIPENTLHQLLFEGSPKGRGDTVSFVKGFCVLASWQAMALMVQSGVMTPEEYNENLPPSTSKLWLHIASATGLTLADEYKQKRRKDDKK